jgi:hypothetical protein
MEGVSVRLLRTDVYQQQEAQVGIDRGVGNGLRTLGIREEERRSAPFGPVTRKRKLKVPQP